MTKFNSIELTLINVEEIFTTLIAANCTIWWESTQNIPPVLTIILTNLSDANEVGGLPKIVDTCSGHLVVF
jgi:hypothetical protein